MTEQPKSWRDQIKVHPAADMFPMGTPDEKKALGEDIRKNGLRVPIALWSEGTDSDGRFGSERSDPEFFLLDGRNRLDAAEAVGLSVTVKRSGWIEINGVEPPQSGRGTTKLFEFHSSWEFPSEKHIKERWVDPFEYVLSVNVHRRHLTAEQKREIVAKVLKAQPSKSNRTIAKQTKVDHKTVASVRAEKEATGEIPQLTKTVGKDGKARTTTPTQKPAAKKKRRDIDDKLAENKAKLAAKAAAAPGPAPQQPEIKEYIERIAALLRDASKEKRMDAIEEMMWALGINIHDWVIGTMTIGGRPVRNPRRTASVPVTAE